jgi:hypothetical protein
LDEVYLPSKAGSMLVNIAGAGVLVYIFIKKLITSLSQFTAVKAAISRHKALNNKIDFQTDIFDSARRNSKSFSRNSLE